MLQFTVGVGGVISNVFHWCSHKKLEVLGHSVSPPLSYPSCWILLGVFLWVVQDMLWIVVSFSDLCIW